MNQNQIAELFATSLPNISMHIAKILGDSELQDNSVVKYFLTTASDGKKYEVAFYSLEMILAIGFRMALTSWAGNVVRKQDIMVAKNYLTKDEIDTLNRLVIVFLETA